MTKLLRKTDVLALAAVLAILLLLPFVLSDFRLNLVGKYLAFAFVAIGIVITWGYGGILSLGQGVFFGLGGYMMAMFLKLEASSPNIPDFMDWSGVEKLPGWWMPFHSLAATIALILVLPAAFAYGLSYSAFRRRISGVYFAIITLCLATTLTVLIIGQQGQTGGANGITNFRTLLGLNIISDSARLVLYVVQAAFLFAMMVLAVFLLRSRFGKVLIAIRDSEDRVRFSGYDTAHFKAFVFMLAGILSAMGGAFYTLQVGLIAPSVVGVASSVEMVIFAAVGGRLSVPGAVVGALLVGFLKSWLSDAFPEIWLYFLGAIFILVVVAMPNGLAGLLDERIRSIGIAKKAA